MAEAVLSALALAVYYLAGSGRRSAWALGFFGQVLWSVYAITTEQWGFLLSVPFFAAVFGRNWLRWRDEREAS